MENNHIKKKKGLTLIELMIAFFIVSFGLVGTFSVIQKIITASSMTSSRLIASYLAQEGMEIVRNVRDNNWLEGAGIDWDLGLKNCFSAPNYCEADYNDQALISGTDRYLKINSSGFYNYDSGTDTIFKRKIKIVHLEAEVLRVVTEVSWEEHGSEKSVVVEEILYDWWWQ